MRPMKSSGCLAIVLAASVARAEPVTKEQVEDAVNVLTHTLTTAEMSRAMNRPVDVRGLVPLIGIPFEYDGFTLADHCETFSRSGHIEAAALSSAAIRDLCERIAGGWSCTPARGRRMSTSRGCPRRCGPVPPRSRVADTLFVAELIHNQGTIPSRSRRGR